MQERTPNLKLQRLLRLLAGTVFSRGVTASGTLLLNLLLARYLPLEQYGRFAFCLTSLIALAIFARFGFDVALLRFGGAAWHNQDYLGYKYASKMAFTTVAIIGCAATIVGEWLLFIFDDGSWPAMATMRLILLSLPFVTLTYISSSSFKAAHRPGIGALFEVGGISLLSCCVILMGRTWLNPISAESSAIVFDLSAAVFCVVSFLLVRALLWSPRTARTSQPAFEGTSFGQYFRTSTDFALIAGAQVVGNWGGLLFLELLHGEASVALFSAALRTALVPTVLLNVVVTICSPRIAGLHQANDRVGLRTLVHRSAGIVFLANFPVLAAICIFAPLVMSAFGSSFQSAWPLLAILASGQFVGVITGMGTSALGMTGHQQLVRRIGLVSSLGAIGLSALLATQYGATGAAIAGAIYATGQALAIAIACYRKLGFLPVPFVRNSAVEQPTPPNTLDETQQINGPTKNVRVE